MVEAEWAELRKKTKYTKLFRLYQYLDEEFSVY